MINQVSTSNLFQTERDLKGILVGNRIPRDYFVTKGTGQSDIAVHAGSYHLALKDANIEMCNIMTYSSILPGIARKVDRPHQLIHGSVMESIMSVCTAQCGQQASAGIIYGWLYDKYTHEKYGGLVCEHFGHYDENELVYNLKASLNELYVNGFDNRYLLQNVELTTQSFIPEKKYGTALVALCFTNYVYPIIE